MTCNADGFSDFVEAAAHPVDDVLVGGGFVGGGPAEDEIALGAHGGVDGAVGAEDVAAEAGEFVFGEGGDDVGALVFVEDLVGRRGRFHRSSLNMVVSQSDHSRGAWICWGEAAILRRRRPRPGLS